MGMTISALSARTGCSPPAIRYYESIGLLPPAPRTAKGRRTFGWPDVSRLSFIRRARDCGLSIEQVKELLDASATPREGCRPAADLIEEHLAAIRKKRSELRLIEQSLQSMLLRCRQSCGAMGGEACSIFEDLQGATDPSSS